MAPSNSTSMQSNEPGGTIFVMWIPCVVFAHAFAAFFLVRMVLVMHPKVWSDIKRKLCCRSPPPPTTVPPGNARVPSAKGPSAAAAAAASDTRQAPDQDRRGTIKAGVGPGAAPRTRTIYFDAAETVVEDDEEMAIGADIPGVSSEGNRGVPSQRSQVLMRRLTTMLKPLLMEWEDIGCSYNTSTGLKTVLKGVYGKAEPGDMLALMGPSGAGKSTLMDILAGRKSVGNLTGAVLVNGAPRKKEEFARKTAYVPQDDNFMPTMTVFETCSYYATLLLPRGLTKAARKERIIEVLAAMGLSHTLETLVGGTLPGGIILRGLSGGERKRLSIATGIMSTPAIVFLDEPTSGLDSFAALSVMSYMRGMAQAGGQTVVSSIHQPRSAIWALFDSAVLLSMGHLMYFGPRDGLVPWFSERLRYPYDPAMHGLASDWVMDLVNIGFKKPESLFGKMMNTMDELDAAALDFRKHYLGQQPLPTTLQTQQQPAAAGACHLSDLESEAEFAALESAYGHQHSGGFTGSEAAATAAAAAAAVSGHSQHSQQHSQLHSAAAVMNGVEARAAAGHHDTAGSKKGLCGLGGKKRHHFSASWFTQLRILLWRELLSVTRNPADVAGRCLIFCWLAIFVGLIYYNLPNSLDSLRARLNVLFVEPVILLLLPYVYMSLYTSDKQYYIADSSAKLYHPSAYYLAKQLAVMPFAILNVLLFSYTLYGLAGLRHQPAAVGMNGLMSVLLYLIAAQVLSFAAVVTPNQDTAFMIAIGWTAVNLLMSNFMVRYTDMTQSWLSQLRYISAMGYGFEGYAQAEFTGVTYSCAGGLAPSITVFIPAFLPNTSQLRAPVFQNFVNNPGADCVVKTDAILEYFQLFRPFWTTSVILVGYLCFFHLLTYIGFLWLTKKERR